MAQEGEVLYEKGTRGQSFRYAFHGCIDDLEQWVPLLCDVDPVYNFEDAGGK